MAAPDDRPDGGGLRVGTVAGAPLVVSGWWFVLALLITVVTAPWFRDVRPSLPDGAEYLLAALLVVLLYLSVLLHELGHAFAARAFGIPVLRVRLEVLGGLTEMTDRAGTPGREAVVAGAGPAVSVAVTVLAGAGWAAAPDGSVSALLLGQVAVVNGLVSVYNLLPGLPLDGGSLLRSTVWAAGATRDTATRVAAWTGRAVAVSTAALPFLLAAALGGRPTVLGLLWFFVIAASIWAGATAELARLDVERAVRALDLRSLLRPVVTVRPDDTVLTAVERARAVGPAAVAVVDDALRPTALVEEAAVAAVPAERQGALAVTAVARTLPPEEVVTVPPPPGTLLEVLLTFERPVRLAVDADGRLVGALVRDEVHAAATGATRRRDGR